MEKTSTQFERNKEEEKHKQNIMKIQGTNKKRKIKNIEKVLTEKIFKGEVSFAEPNFINNIRHEKAELFSQMGCDSPAQP